MPIALPPFRSPRSMAVTRDRQIQRVEQARLDWGSRSSGQPENPPPTSEQSQSSALNLHAIGYSVHHQLLLPPTNDREPSSPFRRPRHRKRRMSVSMAAPHRGVSPSTSPRLPSPPPFPEVQITPNSPKPGLPSGNTAPDLKDASKPDDGAGRRIRPGTKAADMASGPPLVPLVEVSHFFETTLPGAQTVYAIS